MSDENNLGNLNEFGVEFQNKCIAALVSDRLFLERIIDILTPDYFETMAQKWVVEKGIKYFYEYKDIPTTVYYQTELKTIDDQMKLLKTSVSDLLGIVFGHTLDSDLKYVKNQFLEFCRNRTLASAILKSVDDLEKKDYESIKNRIDTALKAGMERNMGHDYIADMAKRHSQAARECIKTGWDIIDELMDGGLGKGELGFIIAPSGAGKTWVLTRLGAEAMIQGKNVLHVTLELNENYVGLRYDAYFSGISFQEVRKHIDQVKDDISKIPGRLFIKYFPIKSITAQSIKLFIDRFQMLYNIKIDLLVVDYADILRPLIPDRNANMYLNAGSVYEELRAVAGELQIPVWSASQGNKSSHESDVVGVDKVSESYKKIMTGDFIVTLARPMEYKQSGVGSFHVGKNRFGPDGLVYPCNFDASCGRIVLYDAASSEGKELLAKMNAAEKDADKNQKKNVKNWWDKLMNDKGNGGD